MATTSKQTKTVFESWIEVFESSWTADTWADFIQNAPELPEDIWLEIARVDVDLRYLRGLEVDLDRYEVIERRLRTDNRDLDVGFSHRWREQIAFEDFRGRSRSPLECDPARWINYLSAPFPRWLEQLQAGSSKAYRGGDPEPPHDLQITDIIWPSPGERIGEFEIVEQIGEGSFSKVYLAVQTSIGRRKVVLKLTTQEQNEPEWLGRFQHENIVPVYSVHRWKEFYLLCMPFWGTLTLAGWMRQQPDFRSRSAQELSETLNSARLQLPSTIAEVPQPGKGPAEPVEAERGNRGSVGETGLQASIYLETATTLFRQLASALKHSHSQGVLHGDLKPANVLIRTNGMPALLDFNLSQESTYRPTQVKGSTPYMAPEQLMGWFVGKPVMTQATDLYALGLMMFEYIVGNLPEAFKRPISTNSLDSIASDRVSFDFRNALIDLPAGFRCILLKLLQPNQDDRYRSATELELDLQREANHQSLKFATEPMWNRIKKFTWRNRGLFSVSSMIVAACVICLVTSIGLWQWRQVALKFEAKQNATQFASHSETLLSKLHSIDGHFDRSSVSQLIQHAKDYHPILFQGGASWGRLNPSDRGSLTNAWNIHILLTSYAGQRLSLFQDSESRKDWLQLCDALPGELAAAKQVTALLDQSEIFAKLDSRDRSNWSVGELYVLASLLGEEHDWKRSQSFLRQLPEAEKKNGLYWFLMARNQFNLDELDGAILSFGLAKDRNFGLIDTAVGRGLIYLKQRRTDEAIVDFTEAIRLAPENWNAYLHRSLAYQTANQWSESLPDLNYVLQQQPHLTMARSMRIRVLEQLGQINQAAEDRKLLFEIEPQHAIDYETRALARLPGDVEGAWNDLCQAEKLAPFLTHVWQNKAYVASEFRKDDLLAIGQLDEVLRISSRDTEALSGRAVLYARLGDELRSIADIEKAIILVGNQSGPTHYHASCVFSLLSSTKPDHLPRASVHLAKALQMGYGDEIVDTDPDLESLRQTKDYLDIVRVNRVAKKASPSSSPN